MSSKFERTILPITFALLAGGLIFVWVKVEKIGHPAVKTEQVNEAGEPMAAAAALTVPKTYVSYNLTRGAGAWSITGGAWVESESWRHIYTPEGEERDPHEFIRDVISTLEKDGILTDVDLTKTKSNWLVIIWPGGTPRDWWTLDSRDLPERTK